MKRSLFVFLILASLCLTATAQETKVWMLGTVNGHNWSPYADGATELTSTDGNVFTGNVMVNRAEANEYGYFSFTKALSTNKEDTNAAWTEIASSRFGATSKDKEIFQQNLGTQVAENNQLKLREVGDESITGDIAFKIKPGYYTITVNLSELTLIVEDHFYIIGQINKHNNYPWNASVGTEMPWDGRVFKKECYVQGASNTDPNGYFSFVSNLDADWSKAIHFSVDADEDITGHNFANQYHKDNITRGKDKTFKIPAGFYFIEILGNTLGGQTLYITRRAASVGSFSVAAGEVEQGTTVNFNSTLQSRVEEIDGNGSAVVYQYTTDGGETWTEGSSYTLNTLGDVTITFKATLGQLSAEATASYVVKEPLDVTSRWKIDDTNFPNAIFRDYIWNHLESIGASTNVSSFEKSQRGTDNIIVDIWKKGFTKADLARVTDITATNLAISDFKGIELFPNLEWLQAEKNTATSIDLSHNKKITIIALSESQSLTEVILPETTEGDGISIVLHDCPAFQSLDISKTANVAGIELNGTDMPQSGFKYDATVNANLATLTINDVQWADLTSVMAAFPSLGIFSTTNNRAVQTIDMSGNSKIWDLNIDNCENLTTITMPEDMPIFWAVIIANCPKLGENMTDGTINLKKYPSLATVHVSNDGLTSFDTDGMINLKLLDVNANKIPSLNVSTCVALEDLECATNRILVKLTLPEKENSSIETIKCQQNILTEVKTQDCPNLKHLECWDNKITGLELKDCPKLNYLGAADNMYETLDVTANTELTWLDCYNSYRADDERSIADLDVSHNTKLTYLRCGANHLIRKLDLTKAEYPDLETFACEQDRIVGYLNTSHCPKLKTFSCWGNINIEKLELTNNTKLVTLECATNQLKDLDVSKCTILENLSFENNHIRNINVKNNPEIVKLLCYNNDLYELDVTTLLKLKTLNCGTNHLNALNLGNCPIDMSIAYAPGTNVPYTPNFNADNNGRKIVVERALTWNNPRQYIDYLRLEGEASDLGANEKFIKDRIDTPVASENTWHTAYVNEAENKGYYNTAADFVLSNVQESTIRIYWSEEETAAPAPRRAAVVKEKDETFKWRDANSQTELEERVRDTENADDNTKGKILVLQEGYEANLASNGKFEYHYATGNAAVPYTTFYLEWEVNSVVTGVEDINIDNNHNEQAITSRIYYSVDGRESTTPHEGVNVVVTTYSDGYRTVSKQLIK